MSLVATYVYSFPFPANSDLTFVMLTTALSKILNALVVSGIALYILEELSIVVPCFF
jgi:hypothetical protein